MKEDIKTRLENLTVPEAPSASRHQKQLKLAIMSSKKSAQASIWLLSIPGLILLGAMLDSLLHISIPPWSILKVYGPSWPLWLRISIFTTSVMVLPLIAFLLNLLSIIWLQYDREQKILNISIRLKTVNLIIVGVAGVLACLFIGHAIADWIAGKD